MLLAGAAPGQSVKQGGTGEASDGSLSFKTTLESPPTYRQQQPPQTTPTTDEGYLASNLPQPPSSQPSKNSKRVPES